MPLKAYNTNIMIFRYQVSIIALIQFITISFLGIANAVYSIVSKCIGREECISNALVSIIYFILVAIWFGFIWVLAYTAQERRFSKKINILVILSLIFFEIIIALVSLVNAKGHQDKLGLVTSIIDLAFALWVIILATILLFNLIRTHEGRRIVRARRRSTRRR